jgi:hypothetical protein
MKGRKEERKINEIQIQATLIKYGSIDFSEQNIPTSLPHVHAHSQRLLT